MLVEQIRVGRAFIYPIKSMRGIPVQLLTINNGRVVGDRMWVVVDANGRFMHQRDYPQMATLGVRATPEGIVLQKPGLPPLFLELKPIVQSAVEHVRLWRRGAPVIHVAPSADAWLSVALGVACRLMQFAEGEEGLDVPDYERDASLQDATAFHITSEDSLNDLNRRIGQPIPMIRFRPNLTIVGAKPYSEDAWTTVRIETHTLRRIRACTRCAITMTDHETGARPDAEPLRTLATYRREGRYAVFGHYLTCDSRSGLMRVGDEIHPIV